MVRVEDYRSLLDRIAGVRTFRANDVETEINFQFPISNCAWSDEFYELTIGSRKLAIH